MANVVITSDFETVFVSFNDFSAASGLTKASYRRADIKGVFMPVDNTHVVVEMSDKSRFEITDDNTYTGAMVVDSVDAVSPIDLDDLFDAIRALQL